MEEHEQDKCENHCDGYECQLYCNYMRSRIKDLEQALDTPLSYGLSVAMSSTLRFYEYEQMVAHIDRDKAGK
jgi:hypothetical protein